MAKPGYEGEIGGYDWGGFIDADINPVNPPAIETQPHYFLGGPASGVIPGLAVFRALVAADIPGIILSVAEVPSGDIDGVNMDYTTAGNFGNLWVFLNGLRMNPGSDYTVTGSDTFTFAYPPQTGDTLIVDYTS